MLLEGLNLMVVGMTTVFSFLALLVAVLQGSARIFEEFGDQWPDQVIAPSSPENLSGSSGKEEIAVVLAVVEAHRQR
ncbi:MAG: sodium pump decarboxylase subunit gamma [Acidobacteria bacterium]|nr:sodium pump decarboxylase subunit gamma [Acidobacteriota bacterium]|tara:strand:- start:1839 stop:2069 length:231 start_codon:yes stop_codon:yes gene_type:complete